MSFMILEKHSALLGYPNETQQPLDANHHDVCKFTDTHGPNYISVVGALRSIVNTVQTSKETEEIEKGADEDIASVTNLLVISGLPEEDIAECHLVRKLGTCRHFLQSEESNNWVDGSSSPVLWIYGPPGGGKPILCSTVVDHLEAGHRCAYFFFKHGRQQKSSVGNMLRSLAYQTTLEVPSYRRALADLARSGVRLDHSDASTIWKRAYLPMLSCETEGFYWVLDGIDESESSKQMVELMSATSGFKSPPRILLPAIAQCFQVAERRIPVRSFAWSSNEDIRLFVAEEIGYLPSDEGFKTQTTNGIIEHAQGNFLWASLVLKRILMCHRHEQVTKVLKKTQVGINELYHRMLSAVADLDLQDDKILAHIRLSWAMYAKTSLTVHELSGAYSAEFRPVIDIKYTVSQVCGQFVVVDTQNRISLVIIPLKTI
ncbi:hypothetical protein Hte_002027 [Hypoxylon texense]